MLVLAASWEARESGRIKFSEVACDPTADIVQRRRQEADNYLVRDGWTVHRGVIKVTKAAKEKEFRPPAWPSVRLPPGEDHPLILWQGSLTDIVKDSTQIFWI
jgi:hypothetical protein